MNEDLRSLLGSTVVLGVLAAVALFLTATRGSGDPDPAARRRVGWLALVTLVFQSGHFAEELFGGFHARFPELLGLPPMSVALFVSFNLFWIALWALSVVGIRRGLRAALFPIWFLALGTALNGIAHPLLALAEGGYFPGLWTALPTGVAGALLLRRLVLFTRP